MNEATGDALKRYVEALALPPGRVVGTAGHDAARRLIVRWLQELGLQPFGYSFELSYDDNFTNIVGVAPGRDRSLPPLLIGAHYDSVIEAPCADDNAAAVAIALEAARALLAEPAERDVVIAIFDAEEPPHFQENTMGSIRFYHDQRGETEFHAVLVMDLVGHDVLIGDPIGKMAAPITAPLLFTTGTESHPGVAEVVRDNLGIVDKLAVVSTLNRYVGDMSDHGVFREAGVPYVFLSCGRWEHYHQPTDTPDRLNYRKMERIRQYLLRLLRGLDAADLSGPGGGDTTELEIESLRKAVGVSGSVTAQTLGIRLPRTREDLDDLIGKLMGLGL